MKRFLTLAKIEFKLSIRTPDVALFVLAMPSIIVGVIGLIYSDRPPAHGGGMLEATFGAFLSIGICAVGLMGLPMVLTDYRHKKVLKRLRVTPASPILLLMVQMAVQAIMAMISAILVTLVATAVFGLRPKGGIGRMGFAWLLVMIAIFSVGLIVASTAKDMKRAGVYCSLLYFPMLLFSGTTIPFPVFPETVRRIAGFLPLRQGIILLNGVGNGEPIRAFPTQLIVLAGISVFGIIVSVRKFRWDMD